MEICIHLEPETLRTLIEGYSEPIPTDLKRAIAGTYEHSILRPGILTPTKQTILYQILNCPYQGLTRKMYLEGKVLELMALKLASEIPDEKKLIKSFALRPQDIERIHHAKEILLCNLNNPPSLLDLARLVGLNECTLKRGFRQVFDTTAFGYLHEYRMQQARQLLYEGRMKVEEVAQAVGYANRSRFAAAFRKKFGINPKAYQKQNNI